MQGLEAVVGAKILELRFPFAGRVEWVGVAVGDRVRRGQELARLDAAKLKMRQEKELKDYEKIRAMFEQLKRRLESSDEPDKRYLMDRAQADLEAAVLAVEMTQEEVGSVSLKSPAAGVVVDDGNLVAGLNITPASFSMRLIVDGSYFIRAKLAQKQLAQVEKNQSAEFRPEAYPDQVYRGRVSGVSPMPPDQRSKDFELLVVLEKDENLRPGMVGQLQLGS